MIKLIYGLFWWIKGGYYNVHPVLILFEINTLIIINISDGTRSQNLKLFIRG